MRQWAKGSTAATRSRASLGGGRSSALFSLLVIGVVASLVGAVGCGGVPQLAGTQPSVEALATAVLDAVAGRDEAALGRLSLDEGEFRAVVWPELPASRPERNLPVEYVWGDLDQKSRAKLAEMLANHGGRRYTLVSVEFTGGDTRYESFVVHRNSRLRVRDAGGEELSLRLFGSVLQTSDGRFKVFSYNVDD